MKVKLSNTSAKYEKCEAYDWPVGYDPFYLDKVQYEIACRQAYNTEQALRLKSENAKLDDLLNEYDVNYDQFRGFPYLRKDPRIYPGLAPGSLKQPSGNFSSPGRLETVSSPPASPQIPVQPVVPAKGKGPATIADYTAMINHADAQLENIRANPAIAFDEKARAEIEYLIDREQALLGIANLSNRVDDAKASLKKLAELREQRTNLY
jgi:hypothetical protein